MSISKAAAMIAAGRAAQKNQSASARAGKAARSKVLSENRSEPERAERVEGPAAAETMRASRGAVDAPGKRHRKPPPQEAIDKRMGEPVGKQMGQKSVKNSMRRGRG